MLKKTWGENQPRRQKPGPGDAGGFVLFMAAGAAPDHW